MAQSIASDSVSDVSLNLVDQRDYYYYTGASQMDEGAMKWLRQYKSEVTICDLPILYTDLIDFFFPPHRDMLRILSGMVIPTSTSLLT